MKPRIAPSGLRSRYCRGAYDDPAATGAGLLDAPFAPALRLPEPSETPPARPEKVRPLETDVSEELAALCAPLTSSFEIESGGIIDREPMVVVLERSPLERIGTRPPRRFRSQLFMLQ